MSSLPPHAHHHEIHSGAENLPTSDLRQPERLEIPLAGGLSLELDTGEDTRLDEKPYPRRRFDLHNFRDVRGSVLLMFYFAFFTRSNTMTSIIAWIRQPTTLQGFALLIFAAAGWFAKVLTPAEAGTAAMAALPLVGIKDNTSTILHQSQANGAALGAPVSAPAVAAGDVKG